MSAYLFRLLTPCSSYTDFVKTKDLQMLAMISMLLLQNGCTSVPMYADSSEGSLGLRIIPNFTGVDYFSLSRTAKDRSPHPPAWQRRPSTPTAQQQLATSLPSSTSSRGSWSSLFNTGTMRQFMTGVQGTLKEGLSTPTGFPNPNHPEPETTMSTPTLENRLGETPGIPRRRQRKSMNLQSPPISASKSWNETLPLPVKPSTSSSSAGHKRTPLTQIINTNIAVGSRKIKIFEPPPEPEPTSKSVFKSPPRVVQI